MAQVNVVALSGRLVKEPVVRSFTKKDGSEGFLSAFTLASGKDKNVIFMDVTIFTKVGNFLVKGQEVTVSGKLIQDKYTSEAGKEVVTTKIVGDDLMFGNRPGGSNLTKEAPKEVEEDIDIPF